MDPKELATCFDLPPYIEWNPIFVTAIVPLQLFRAVIDFVLVAQCISSPAPAKSQRLLDSSAPVVPMDGVWLPSIGAWLSGAWADVDIANKAVKADDALVDTRPWHKRVSLVLPCQPRTLGVLERLCMRRWRHLVITSFFTYLRRVYGDNWVSLLRPGAPNGPEITSRKRLFESVCPEGGGIRVITRHYRGNSGRT